MNSNIPDYMLAIEISKPGAADVLVPTKRRVPSPNKHEVLIKVAASGINRADVMQRKGLYPPPPGASDIPGLEVSGTVVAVGTAVTHIKIGDPVCALTTGGGYAEYCLVAATLCLPVPKGLNMIQAAALPETFFTVWSNLFNLAKFCAGETLLIHGGSSGIGTTAIQLAKAFGGNVIITAGSDNKCNFCKKLGADFVINYKHQDFVEEIKQITNGLGVDTILDMIGADYFPRNIKCLAAEGRLVQIGLQNGTQSSINLLPLLLKRITITGSTLRSRNTEFKQAIANQLLEKVWPLLADSQIRPIIDSTFPLDKAVQAHQRIENSEHIGKIILSI